MKNVFQKIAAAMVLFTPFMITAGEAPSIYAEELLEVMQFTKVMNETIAMTVETMKQSDPLASEYEDILNSFYQKHMNSELLRNDVAALYSELFTGDELQELVAFYKTPLGLKILEKQPIIMQRAIQMAQSYVLKNINELGEMLSE